MEFSKKTIFKQIYSAIKYILCFIWLKPRRYTWKVFIFDFIIAGTLFAVLLYCGAMACEKCYMRGDRIGIVSPTPAVSFACGKGMENRILTTNKARSFMRKIPSSGTFDEKGLGRAVKMDRLHTSHLYLLFSIGVWWRIRGNISWMELMWLQGIFMGILGVSAYCLLRMVGGLLPSIAGAVFYSFGGAFGFLMRFRDFTPIIFMIGLAVMVIWFMSRKATWKRLVIYSVATAVIHGIGLGFRTNILILLPVTIMPIFICGFKSMQLYDASHIFARLPKFILSPARKIRDAFRKLITFFAGLLPKFILKLKNVNYGWKIRLMGTLVFLFVYIISGLPIIISIIGSGNSSALWHVAYLGMGDLHDSRLRVSSPYHRWMLFVSDEHNLIVASSRAYSRDGKEIPELYSEDYGYEIQKIFLDTVLYFPADMVTRSFAAIKRCLNISFERPVSVNITNNETLAKRVIDWRYANLPKRTELGCWLVLAALLIVAAFSWVRAWTYVLFFAYMLGSQCIQYQERHFFGFGIFGILALIFIISYAPRLLAFGWRRKKRLFYYRKKVGVKILKLLLWFVITVAAFLLPLYGLRYCQSKVVSNMIYDNILKLPREKVTITEKKHIPGTKFVSLNCSEFQREVLYKDIPPSQSLVSYWVLCLDGSKLKSKADYYMGPEYNRIYRNKYSIEPNEKLYYIFPIYHYPDRIPARRYKGLVISEFMEPMITGLYHIKKLDAFPVPAYFYVSQNPQCLPVYQSMEEY